MKLPRFLTTRPASILALVCALLGFAAVPGAQAQIKVVALDSAALDKMVNFVNTVNADPADKAAMDEMGKDQELGTTMMSGGSINDMVSTKYPKAAAVFKKGSYTPDEFNATLMSLAMAAMGNTDATSDAAVAKKNIDFYNANKEKVDKLKDSMH